MKKLLFFVVLASVVAQFGCMDKTNIDSITSKNNAEKISTSASSVSDKEQLKSDVTNNGDGGFNQKIHYENIRGNYQDGKQETKIIESEEDMNYILEKLDIIFLGNLVTVQTDISGEKIESELKLYPSQIGDREKRANKVVGIEQKTDINSYSILKFTIHKEADEESLFILNKKWKGKTVLSLAFYNKNNNKEKYYFQILLDDLDYDSMYQIANNNLKNDAQMSEKIMNIELAYFTMEPLEEFLKRLENESNADGKKGSTKVN